MEDSRVVCSTLDVFYDPCLRINPDLSPQMEQQNHSIKPHHSWCSWLSNFSTKMEHEIKLSWDLLLHKGSVRFVHYVLPGLLILFDRNLPVSQAEHALMSDGKSNISISWKSFLLLKQKFEKATTVTNLQKIDFLLGSNITTSIGLLYFHVAMSKHTPEAPVKWEHQMDLFLNISMPLLRTGG